MKPANYVWTADDFQTTLIDTLPENRYFVTGTVTNPPECYHTVPVDQKRDCMHLCMDATVGYDLDIFAGNGISAINDANFAVWSTIVVPEESLSTTALNTITKD
jgi:hypothetical protein